MGAWGAGLFESDQDADIVILISREAGMDLETPEDLEHGGKGMDYTIKSLNEGLFDKLFDKYKNEDLKFGIWGGKYYTIILTALAMELGANISDDQKSHVRSIFKSAGLYKESIAQVEDALNKYVSGKPYKFVSPRVVNTLPTTSCSILLNHFGPRYYQDNVPTHNPAVRTMQLMGREPALIFCDACGKFERQSLGGRKLKRCGRCKKASYCDHECQKHGWKAHKKVCAKWANEQAGRDDESTTASASTSNPAGL